MKKKHLSLILAAVMAISMCACGSNEGKPSTVESPVTQSSETQANTIESEPENDSIYPLVDEPITVKGVVVTSNTSNGNDRVIWDEVAKVTGITIEWEIIDSLQAFTTLLASGDWPDVFFANFDSTMLYDYGVLGNKLVNYLEYLDVMPNLAQTMEDYPLLKKGATLTNGALYKLGFVNVATTSTKVRPYVNTSVLEKAGVKMPTTVDEFEQALKDLKDFYGVPSFVPRLNAYPNTWAPMLYAAFGTGCNPQWDIDDSGNVYYAAMTDQMRHYYEFLNKLYEQELIHQELATIEWSAGKEYELSGKVAFLDYSAESYPADENGEWHISLVPPLTSQYDSTQEVWGTTFISMTNSFHINNDSKYVKELCQLIDIAYASEEVVEGSGLHGMSFVYGIEGKHWDLNDDGKTYHFYDVEGYDDFNQFVNNKLKWYNIGRADYMKDLVPDTPSNSQSRQFGFVENVNPYMESDPFPWDLLVFTEDQQSIISNKWTEIQTYVEKMQVEFVTGVTDIESGWDVYCDTLKRMGIEEVINVYQEAYEALKTK